jgi:hypothetical protein
MINLTFITDFMGFPKEPEKGVSVKTKAEELQNHEKKQLLLFLREFSL